MSIDSTFSHFGKKTSMNYINNKSHVQTKQSHHFGFWQVHWLGVPWGPAGSSTRWAGASRQVPRPERKLGAASEGWGEPNLQKAGWTNHFRFNHNDKPQESRGFTPNKWGVSATDLAFSLRKMGCTSHYKQHSTAKWRLRLSPNVLSTDVWKAENWRSPVYCSGTSAGLFLQLDLLYELPAQHKLKQEFSSCGVSGQGGLVQKWLFQKGNWW